MPEEQWRHETVILDTLFIVITSGALVEGIVL